MVSISYVNLMLISQACNKHIKKRIVRLQRICASLKIDKPGKAALMS